MAWVRYDDQFYNNRKVTAVIAERVENVAALGLHALANTWSSGQRWPGFVPRHQPNILVCDRERGTEWATVLVQHGLWHDVSDMCEDCQEEYADLPKDMDGYVFHNANQYRPPGRERTTPGTPPDLSEKRREAGRKGGKARAAREQANRDAQANQANSASKPSTVPLADVSPVPVPGPEGTRTGTGSQSSSRRNARAMGPDDDDSIDLAVVELLTELTGRDISIQHAAKVRRQILDGRTVKRRMAYVLRSIQDDPAKFAIPPASAPSLKVVPPLPPWCGYCHADDYRWIETADGRWARCQECNPDAAKEAS